MKKVDLIYDPNFPPNTTLVKDFPGVVRKKGEQLKNTIDEIELNRTSSSIANAKKTFDYNMVFITENSEIPNGMYLNDKTNNYWVGCSDFSTLPSNTDTLDIGTRITIYNKTYELKEVDGIKIWCQTFGLKPKLFFDFFEFVKEDTVLTNKGFGNSDITLTINNAERKEPLLPYITTKQQNKIITNMSYINDKTFTLTATFKNIKRSFEDNTVIDINHKSVIYHIKDEFANIHTGICYDKSNNLFYFVGEEVFPIGIFLSENKIYQITLQYINKKLNLIIDNELIKTFELDLDGLKLLFAVGNDNMFGRYATGSFEVADLTLFKEVLTKEEIMWLYVNPRNWTFYTHNSYLDLSLEEKIKLKKLLKED